MMLRLAKISFLLLIFSLAFMKGAVPIAGFLATSTDVLFLVTAAALGVAVLAGDVRLRWDPFYALLIVYFAAMAASVAVSAQPDRSLFKLATQAYLLSLPVLGATLIESIDDLRTVFRVWLAASAVPALMGTLTVVMFFLGVDRSLLDYPLHEFGTLPPGNYPRVEATFLHPAMFCNYLTVSLIILLAGQQVGWVGKLAFRFLFGVIMLAALFTLTPGLGGVFLAVGIWTYLRLRARKRLQALASLAAGGFTALLFVLSAMVTPIIYPTAPFLIHLPGLDVAPAVRMLTWLDSAKAILHHPWLGSGIGTDAAAIPFVVPSGEAHFLTDAHNVFLNIAAQTGLIGLAALVLLILGVARKTGPLTLEFPGILRVAIGIAWLIAFAYEGLTGSYEDSRHLWVLLGLLLASARLDDELSLARR